MSMLVPIVVLGGLGAALGIGLAVAARVFAVEEDPRVDLLVDALPGANCGACGYPGCSGYAKALAAGEAETNLCSPGGNDTVAKVAEILGVEATVMVEKVALVHCAGTRTLAPERSTYLGPQDCRTAALVTGGSKACAWGCLGFGSCVDVCPEHAIEMVDGLAHVRQERCTGCGLCVKACPRDIIELVPKDRSVHVLCSSKDPGKMVKGVCKVGCIACKLCTRQDKQTFQMAGDLARVDYENGKDVPTAAMVCTPGAIWNRDEYDLVAFLTDPTTRSDLKSAQKAYKEAERAKKKAAKEKKAAAEKAKKEADDAKADEKPDAKTEKPGGGE